MKRFLTAIAACIILFVTLGASAEASTSGAARAVEREVKFDNDPDYAYSWCKQAGFHHYTCQIRASMYYGDSNHHGKARVTQFGKRYLVDYRIY